MEQYTYLSTVAKAEIRILPPNTLSIFESD